MKQCKEYRELFVEVYYNELPPDAKKEAMQHIASCKECSAEYKRLEGTLLVMNKRSRVEPDEEYWKNYWNRLNTTIEQETELDEQPRNNTQKRFAWQPAWAYGIAATVLIAAGLFLGKLLYSPETTIQQPPAISKEEVTPQYEEPGSPEQPQLTTVQPQKSLKNYQILKTRAATNDAARSYINRSKVMLLGIINSDEDDSPSLSRQQKVSRSLLHEAIELKPKLIEPDQQRIKQLIEELEVILLQLANFEEQADLPAIELIKKGVDQKSILLKINMEEMRMMKSRDVQKPSTTNEKKNSL